MSRDRGYQRKRDGETPLYKQWKKTYKSLDIPMFPKDYSDPVVKEEMRFLILRQPVKDKIKDWFIKELEQSNSWEEFSDRIQNNVLGVKVKKGKDYGEATAFIAKLREVQEGLPPKHV